MRELKPSGAGIKEVLVFQSRQMKKLEEVLECVMRNGRSKDSNKVK